MALTWELDIELLNDSAWLTQLRAAGQCVRLVETRSRISTIYECRRQSSQKHTSLVCLRETRFQLRVNKHLTNISCGNGCRGIRRCMRSTYSQVGKSDRIAYGHTKLLASFHS